MRNVLSLFSKTIIKYIACRVPLRSDVTNKYRRFFLVYYFSMVIFLFQRILFLFSRRTIHLCDSVMIIKCVLFAIIHCHLIVHFEEQVKKWRWFPCKYFKRFGIVFAITNRNFTHHKVQTSF